MTSPSPVKISSENGRAIVPSDPEKDVSEATSTPISESQPFTKADTRKLLRKLDVNLIPFLALIYLLCFLDRTNVGNAKLFDLESDLHMKGLQYNIALAVFFPFYIAAEIPSNMMMKRIRPSIWLTFIMISWGIVMTCMGLVRNFQGLMACRAFLGIAEAGLFPGVNYYITTWYRRHECGFRMALFFSAATAAGAFGGLLARAIGEMNGIAGLAAWSWIFIIEGLGTLTVASIAIWIINDCPATAKFLTPSERNEVERRLLEDSDLCNDFHLKYLFQALGDWKIWMNMFITVGVFSPVYSFSLFVPTIIKDMKYSNNAAQLMSVPPYVVACICTIAGSYAADRSRQRGVYILGFQLIAILGFILLAAVEKPHLRYLGTFFAAAGTYPLVPLIGAWNSNNIGGSLKRGVGIAMQIGFGNLGGIIASFIYLPSDAPRFIEGHTILVALISTSFILTSIMAIYLRRENARRDAVLREMGTSCKDSSPEMRWGERENGDSSIFFRYTV